MSFDAESTLPGRPRLPQPQPQPPHAAAPPPGLPFPFAGAAAATTSMLSGYLDPAAGGDPRARANLFQGIVQRIGILPLQYVGKLDVVDPTNSGLSPGELRLYIAEESKNAIS